MTEEIYLKFNKGKNIYNVKYYNGKSHEFEIINIPDLDDIIKNINEKE